MDSWWVTWPLFIVFLYFGIKAYGHLRDHHGSDDNNWLEGVGAFYLAPFVAPFMPFIMLRAWLRERRAKARAADHVEVRASGKGG